MPSLKFYYESQKFNLKFHVKFKCKFLDILKLYIDADGQLRMLLANRFKKWKTSVLFVGTLVCFITCMQWIPRIHFWYDTLTSWWPAWQPSHLLSTHTHTHTHTHIGGT